MKIAFVAHQCLPFHGNSLLERPLGGTETSIIRIAEALSRRGHDVAVFTALEHPPQTVPRYLPFAALDRIGPLDALVAVRSWLPLMFSYEVGHRIFWTGDAHDQLPNFGLGDARVVKTIDAFIAQSAWHAHTMSQASGFPLEKTVIIPLGVHLPFFMGSEERDPYRLIYSSMPYRGLAHVPRLLRRLREHHPQAEIHVFSGTKVYAAEADGKPDNGGQFAGILSELAKTPGCVLRGNVSQYDLAREFMRARLLFYPNTFAETFCVTAAEAQAGGCVVLTSALGALPETIGDAGFVIPGRPGEAAYDSQFVETAVRILADPQLAESLAQKGRERAATIFSYDRMALSFEHLLHNLGMRLSITETEIPLFQRALD